LRELLDLLKGLKLCPPRLLVEVCERLNNSGHMRLQQALDRQTFLTDEAPGHWGTKLSQLEECSLAYRDLRKEMKEKFE
jgi:hypothetical protein